MPSQADELESRFASLASLIGTQALKGLAAISTIVGMECPGTHSMLSDFNVNFDEALVSGAISVKSDQYRDVYKRVHLSALGLGIRAEVAAFVGESGLYKATPEYRPDFTDILPLAPQGTHLILGGMSGLGAATAKLLARAGADLLLTWNSSEQDIVELMASLDCDKGERKIHHFDINDEEMIDIIVKSISHGSLYVYYFLTPRIFRRRIDVFDHNAFELFYHFYVRRFYQICHALAMREELKYIRIFYPSSIAIDENNAELFEYTVAKKLGEDVCRLLERRFKHLSVLIERLPRVVTQQTTTRHDVHAYQSIDIMAPIIRALHDYDAGAATALET